MGTLFEGFQIVCTDYDYILGKRGDSIQGRTLFMEIRYVKTIMSTNKVPLTLEWVLGSK